MSVWKWWIAIAGISPGCRGSSLDLEALGHRRNRRSGAVHRCCGSLLYSRPLFALGRLHGVGVATGDEPRVCNPRLRHGGGPSRVRLFFRSLFNHRIRNRSCWAPHRRRRAAELPAGGGGIFISAVVWLVIGIWLVVSVMLRGASHSTRGTSGTQEAEPQPRIR